MNALKELEMRIATLEILIQNLYAKHFMESYSAPSLEAMRSLLKANAKDYHVSSLQGEVDDSISKSLKERTIDFFENNLSIVISMQHYQHNSKVKNIKSNPWHRFFEDEYEGYKIVELSEIEIECSDLVRRIWLDNEDTKKSFIIKELSDSKVRNEIVKAYSLFDREICFYHLISPHKSIPCPDLITVSKSAPYLILEDLGKYISGDQEFGYTVEEAKSVIDEMAKFHRHWLNHETLSDLPVPNVNNELIVKNMPLMLETAWDKLSALFNEKLGYDASLYMKKLINNIESITASLSNQHNVILHGDLRLDNILFEKYKAKYFLDWQMMATGSPMVDIAYFISQSGNVDCQDEIKAYAFNVYSQSIYDGNVALMEKEYENALLLNLSTPVFAALGDLGSNEHPRNIATESFCRAMTHIRAAA